MAYFPMVPKGGAGGFSELLIDYDPNEMAGIAITLSHAASAEGHTPESYTTTLDNTGEVEVDVKNLGLWVITWTHEGQNYREEYDVHYYGYHHIMLHEGFIWRQWVVAGGINIQKYNSLADLLANQEDIRRLCTIHAAVDYMCEFASVNNDLQTIINTGLFAKWVNLRDYAFDNMEANSAIKDAMDEADLYGYGELVYEDDEWKPKGNVPVMTSNSAPYGEAYADSTYQSSAYQAFDGDDTTIWYSPEDSAYVQYKHTCPILAKKAYVKFKHVGTRQASNTFTIKGSNDGSTWDTLGTYTNTHYGEAGTFEVEIELNSSNYHLYHRLDCVKTNTGDSGYGESQIITLQFYGRELKVSVPTMTSNSAPYGEVSAAGTTPYKAFDGDYTKTSYNSGWYGSGNRNQRLAYKFNSPISIEMFSLKDFLYAGDYGVGTYKIQYSDNGTDWEDATEEITKASHGVIEAKPLTGSDLHQYWAAFVVIGSPDSQRISVGILNLQFYGKDYSEKEFANDGSKWLYDHGVELETIGYSIGTSGRAEDLGESLYSESNGTQNANRSACYVNLDLTDYSLARVRGVRQATQYATLGVFETPTVTTIASATANGSKDLPDALGLDISSINAQKYLSIHTDGNGAKFEVAEWWLE